MSFTQVHREIKRRVLLQPSVFGEGEGKREASSPPRDKPLLHFTLKFPLPVSLEFKWFMIKHSCLAAG